MFSRFFRRSPSLRGVELLLLSKDDCHLCDTAIETIRPLERRHGFVLRVVKIRPGDEWYDRYWDKIPVGMAGGRMLFKYRVDPKELLEKLRNTPRD